MPKMLGPPVTDHAGTGQTPDRARQGSPRKESLKGILAMKEKATYVFVHTTHSHVNSKAAPHSSTN